MLNINGKNISEYSIDDLIRLRTNIDKLYFKILKDDYWCWDNINAEKGGTILSEVKYYYNLRVIPYLRVEKLNYLLNKK